jgi:hypothetical protein
MRQATTLVGDVSMAIKFLGVAVAIALALAGAALADTPDQSNDRYTMSPVDGGFLRLDKQTGAVSMCAKAGADWACKAVDDHAAAAAPGEISRLEDENKALKERVKALEESLETGKNLAPPVTGPPGGKIQLPTDEEVDQALDYVERIYKKFRDRIKDLDKPQTPTPPGEAAPPKGAL